MTHDPVSEQSLQAQLCLRSDADLYVDAIFFAANTDLPDTKQLTGLLTYARSWEDLITFIKHQSERTWDDRRAYYSTFYIKLLKYLAEKNTGLRDLAKNKWGFSPERAGQDTHEKQRVFLNRWVGELAREFIQHLCADALYRKTFDSDFDRSR